MFLSKINSSGKAETGYFTKRLDNRNFHFTAFFYIVIGYTVCHFKIVHNTPSPLRLPWVKCLKIRDAF